MEIRFRRKILFVIWWDLFVWVLFVVRLVIFLDWMKFVEIVLVFSLGKRYIKVNLGCWYMKVVILFFIFRVKVGVVSIGVLIGFYLVKFC